MLTSNFKGAALLRPDEGEERGRIFVRDVICLKEDAIGVGRVKRKRVHADVGRLCGIADRSPVIVARGEIETIFVVFHGHSPFVALSFRASIR